MSRLIFLCSVLCLLNSAVYCAVGDTFICKWKDNKRGAFNMAFDGDYESARKAAMPKIIQRGLPVSLYYNPGMTRYSAGIDFWETAPSRYGWEIGQKQMESKYNMCDWGDMDDARYQVGEAARIVWSLRPPGSTKLHIMTEWPEGTSGGLDSAQWTELTTTYHIIRGADGVGSSLMPTASWTYAQLIARPQYAYDTNTNTGLLFHQIGQYGEYEYVVNEAYFEQYLDWLAAKRDVLWVANCLDIYCYIKEYDSAVANVTIRSPDIRLTLASSQDASLYTQPLTLITQVPSTWTYCRVTQGDIEAKKVYPVDVWPSSATVMFDAIPGWGEVILEENSSLDVSAPSAVSVSDGLSSDINTTNELHQLSANWTASADAETGIKKYWYKIGTSAGGSEMMDWIDNGTYTYVTVTRTHLSLVRGTTYYFTVKAENGQGLPGAPASSNGQCVAYVPNYIKFSDGFETGNTGKWDSAAAGVTVVNSASRAGAYCMKAALSSGGGTALTKGNFNTADDLYLSFYFKLGANFSMQSDRINIALMTDSSGGIVAMLFINYFQSMYLLNCEFVTDDNMWPSIPDGVVPYSPGILPHVGVNVWHRVDIHTKADANRKGGAELWVDGVKSASFLEKYTATKAARNLRIGAVGVSSTSAGDIYFDEIVMSDSLISYAAQASTSADTTPPSDIAWVNDGALADQDELVFTDFIPPISAYWSASTDAESGITKYWYAIGTIPGGTDIVGWTDNGTATNASRSVILIGGTTYYFSVRAENGVGLQSAVTMSDGQLAKFGGDWSSHGRAYPNPYDLSGNQSMKFYGISNGEIKIYTVSGKMVRELKAESGVHSIEWDGTNEDGQKVARGIYLYKLTYNGGIRTGKLAVK